MLPIRDSPLHCTSLPDSLRCLLFILHHAGACRSTNSNWSRMACRRAVASAITCHPSPFRLPPPSSGQQWVTNPIESTQMPSQDTMSAQQGNAMGPTQPPPIPWRLYSQPGPFNMLAQPSAAQSRADTAPNILLPGQTLESVPENGLFLFLQANFQPCFSDSRSVF